MVWISIGLMGLSFIGLVIILMIKQVKYCVD